MDLKEQRYVCTLAECGNLTRAAEKLYISQPALSIYITNLEKTLGVPLFDRNGKKFVLTYAGEKYVERAEKMLELEREFNDELMGIISENSGRIRLGVSLRRGPWLIPPVVAKYREKWPNVEVIIREWKLSDLSEMLKNSELDIIILNRADIADDMEVCPILKEEFLLAVPQMHPLNAKAEYVPGARYRKISPEHLNGQELILHYPLLSSRKIEDEILRQYNIVPSKIQVLRSMELMYQMVAEGLGISFIREGYAHNMRYKKRVNYYTLDTEGHQKELVAAYKKGVELPEFMKDMIKILQEHGESFFD